MQRIWCCNCFYSSWNHHSRILFRNYVTSKCATGTIPVHFHITKFDTTGKYKSENIKKVELLSNYGLQPRDVRFSAPSSLYLRNDNIILRLQHIKAIINSNDVILMESDHPTIKKFLPEFKKRLQVTSDSLPFELRVMETLLAKMFTELDDKLNDLQPSISKVLNSLVNPVLSIDKAQLQILLQHSKSLSEFNSLVKDIQETLSYVLDYEEDMAEMYLTHYSVTGEVRNIDDTEDLGNILEAFYMQTEDMLSRSQQLRESIDQSESIILINLDSQRNVMLRLSLQLGMGMFSMTLAGMMGVAFGMNLDSSLEENQYAFWIVTGSMVTLAGLMWRHLLRFLGKTLQPHNFLPSSSSSSSSSSPHQSKYKST